MRNTAAPLILLFLLILDFTPSAAAPPAADCRWSLTIGWTYRADNGRDDELRAALIAGGFDDVACGMFGCSGHPYVTNWHTTVDLGLAYRWSDRWGLRLSGRSGRFADANGLDGSSYAGEMTSLDIETRLTTSSLEAEFTLPPWFRLGAGPALHRLSALARQEDPYEPLGDTVDTRPGIVFRFSLVAPSRSRFFGFLSVRRFEGPQAEVGPFGAAPATKITLSHTAWTLGTGARW